jgi:hypothetical protein
VPGVSPLWILLILLQYVTEQVSHACNEHYYVYMHVCLFLLVHVVQSLSSYGNAKDHKTYRMCHVKFMKLLEHFLVVIWSNKVTWTTSQFNFVVELSVGILYRWEQNQFFIPLLLVSTTTDKYLRWTSLEFLLLLVVANLKQLTAWTQQNFRLLHSGLALCFAQDSIPSYRKGYNRFKLNDNPGDATRLHLHIHLPW